MTTTRQSELLSNRKKQPGNDRSFEESENRLYDTLKKFLSKDVFKVEGKHNNDLLKMFAGQYGVQADAKVTHLPSNKVIYFEVKRQNNQGNAEERAYKTHTVQFQKVIREKLGLPYHPFVLIFCDSLATNPRYTVKFEYYVEPYHYLLWKDYDEKILWDYLRRIFNDWFSEDIGSYEYFMKEITQ